LTKLRPIQIFFEIYKEKEMPDFRKWILALAVVAVFSGLANAQVGTATGPPSGAFTCSTTNGAVTPTLRTEGYTELVGDIVIICTGGASPALGSTIATANFTVFLSTPVTSRLINTGSATGASEALLLIDEPGSGEPGYGPTVAQTPCITVNVGAGAGGCTEYVGTIGANAGVPVSGSPTSTTPGANVFQGIVSGNQVVFEGIPVLPPATAGDTRVYRITNIRANANAAAGGGTAPGTVSASLSINSSTSLTLQQSTLTVGFVVPGLASAFRNTGNSGSSSGSSLAQCTSQSITGTSGTSGALGILQFAENFATAFKVRGAPTQNVPGQIFNSESGFTLPTITATSSITGSTQIAGYADYGTRLKAVFNNVPSGVTLYVSTRDITNDFNASPATTYPNGQAVLVLSETAVDSGPVLPGTGNLGGAIGTASTATTVYGPATGISLAPVAINASTGTGFAVWEVINTNPNTIDTINFGLYATYTASTATNSPAPGTFSVTLSYAPTPSTTGISATNYGASSSVAPSPYTIPRFSDSLDVTKTVATIGTCTTALLYPYVINVNGFDTGLAIANTTTDPFGTANQQGTCSLYFYGSSAPTTNPFVTPVVATGTDYANLASTLAPGFDGYMIANCNFQLAHGFAFVSDVGARNLAMGYLPLILTRSGTNPEALNN
jgi:hypothetical protein